MIMVLLRKALSFVMDNVFPAVLASLGIFALFQKVRADSAADKAERLEEEVEVLKIKEEANEVRSRPVPADKRVILDRM